MLLGVGEVCPEPDAHHVEDAPLVVPTQQLGDHRVLGRLAGAGAEKDDVVIGLHPLEGVVPGELTAHVETVPDALQEQTGGEGWYLLLAGLDLHDVELDVRVVGWEELAGLVDHRARDRIRPARHLVVLIGLQVVVGFIGPRLPIAQRQRRVLPGQKRIDRLVGCDTHHPQILVVGPDLTQGRVVVLDPELLEFVGVGRAGATGVVDEEIGYHVAGTPDRLVVPGLLSPRPTPCWRGHGRGR